MITDAVLVDTGPLVALLHRQDRYHERCKEQAALIGGLVYTSWPVLTEAAWLLRGMPGSLPRLLQLVSELGITCLHLDAAAAPWLTAVAIQFNDLSPQLADLSLLYLAEQHGVRHLFTLDRRDFSVYRTTKGEPFALLPETI